MTPNGGRRVSASFLLVCVATLLAAGCGQSKKPNLALACGIQKCICRAESASIFASSKAGKEVLWRQNGDAYCPEGYFLRKVEE